VKERKRYLDLGEQVYKTSGDLAEAGTLVGDLRHSCTAPALGDRSEVVGVATLMFREGVRSLSEL
jgi:hypothetical protein